MSRIYLGFSLTSVLVVVTYQSFKNDWRHHRLESLTAFHNATGGPSSSPSSSSSNSANQTLNRTPFSREGEQPPIPFSGEFMIEDYWTQETKEFVADTLRLDEEKFGLFQKDIKGAAASGKVITALANEKALPSLRTWWHNAMAAANNKTHGIMVSALDEATIAWAKSVGAHYSDIRFLCPWLQAGSAVSAGPRASFYGAAFCKPKLFNACIRAGVDTILLDADILVTRDLWSDVLRLSPTPKVMMQCGERGRGKESKEFIDGFPLWPNTGVVLATTDDPYSVRFSDIWVVEMLWSILAHSKVGVDIPPRPYIRNRRGLAMYSLSKLAKGLGTNNRHKRRAFGKQILLMNDTQNLTIGNFFTAVSTACRKHWTFDDSANISYACNGNSFGPYTKKEWAERETTPVPWRVLHQTRLRPDGFDGAKYAEQETAREAASFPDLLPPHLHFQCMHEPMWRFAFEMPGDKAGLAAFLEKTSLVHFTGKGLSTGMMEIKNNAMLSSPALAKGVIL